MSGMCLGWVLIVWPQGGRQLSGSPTSRSWGWPGSSMPACVVNSPTHLHDRGWVQADVAACSLAGARAQEAAQHCSGHPPPCADMLAQEDEEGRNAAAYHQLLRLSVCPSAAFLQTRSESMHSSGLLRSFGAAENGSGGNI